MAKHVIVGCAGLPHGVGWPRYFKKLPYLETPALLRGPVRAAVMRRWREAAAHERAFGVVAPASVTHSGHFRDNEAVEKGVVELSAALEALDAGAAVFRTPPEFSPSQANRDVMRKFFAERATAERLGNRARVWVPSGLWEAPVAHAFAKELGILCGLDPLANDPEKRLASFWDELSGDDAYLIISGMGRSRRRTANDDLELLTEIAARHDRAWVVFATVDPFPDAIRFAKLVGASSGASADASDDEDEPIEDDDEAEDDA